VTVPTPRLLWTRIHSPRRSTRLLVIRKTNTPKQRWYVMGMYGYRWTGSLTKATKFPDEVAVERELYSTRVHYEATYVVEEIQVAR